MDRGAWRVPLVVHGVAQTRTEHTQHAGKCCRSTWPPGNAVEAPGPGGCLEVGGCVNGAAILQWVIPEEGNADFILNLLSLQTELVNYLPACLS